MFEAEGHSGDTFFTLCSLKETLFLVSFSLLKDSGDCLFHDGGGVAGRVKCF